MKILKAFLVFLFALVAVGVIAAALLVRRGFRATETPSASEAALARTLRNLAIPRQERDRKNPLAETADSSGQGRESFVAQCAGCHGIDGRGKTPMGVNLYPRVPDLRAAATQTLTDGEIHYIIENGVQLTGMPAWEPHKGLSADSWKLVLFIRSLRPLNSQEQSLQTAMARSAEIYARWKKTPMANVVRDPRAHPEAIIPNLATNNIAKFSVDQVAFVYGSLWKQRYFTKVGDDYYPLPVQWVVGNKTWRPYLVPAKGGDWWASIYPPDNLQRPPVLYVTVAIPSTTTSRPSRWRSGTSVVSAATDRAASMWRIPRAGTFWIRRKWMAWLPTTPASNVIRRDSL